MKRTLWHIPLLIFMAMLVAACSGSDTAGKKKSKEQLAAERTKDSLSIKIGVAKTIDCLPALVARDEGIFDSLGVDVKLVFFTSLLDCEAQLVKGNIDGAFMDTKRTDYIKERLSLETEALAQTKMQYALMACRKSRLKSVGQLAEKTVGMARHSVSDYLTDKVLDSVKMDKEKVFKIQVNDVDLRLKMLVSGEIDAAWLAQPQISEALRYGCNILAYSNAKEADMSVFAFTRKALADKRKEKQARIFVDACRLAEKNMARQTPEARQKLTVKYYGYAAK